MGKTRAAIQIKKDAGVIIENCIIMHLDRQDMLDLRNWLARLEMRASRKIKKQWAANSTRRVTP